MLCYVMFYDFVSCTSSILLAAVQGEVAKHWDHLDDEVGQETGEPAGEIERPNKYVHVIHTVIQDTYTQFHSYMVICIFCTYVYIYIWSRVPCS